MFMLRNSNSHKWAASIAMAVTLLATLLLHQSWSQDKSDPGVTVSGNKATLKPGFRFHRVSDKQMQVRRHSATSETTVTITCSCVKPPTKPISRTCESIGGPRCSVSIVDNSAVCNRICGCQECKMNF